MVGADNPLEGCLLVIINIVFCDGDIEVILHRPVIKLFNQGRLRKIIRIEEEDKLSAGAVKTLVSCNGRSGIRLCNNADAAVLFLIFL